MRKNRIVYIILQCIVFLLILSISIAANGCSRDAKGTVAETEETITVTGTPEETRNVEETAEATSEDTSEQTIPEETASTESTDTDKNEDIILFRGNSVNGNKAVMILEVNIITGDISGLIQMGFKSFDMDLSNTKICDYILEGSITGSVDLQTLEITGEINGKAVTDTQSEACNDYNVNYSMTAVMMWDKSRIKGYFDTKTQDEWEFFLKNVNE